MHLNAPPVLLPLRTSTEAKLPSCGRDTPPCGRAGSATRIIPPNKRTYQQDPANYREALREAELDEAEGADIMMVKPGMPYLDVIRALRDNSTLPIAAYHVSGARHWLQVGTLGHTSCGAYQLCSHAVSNHPNVNPRLELVVHTAMLC